MDYGNTQAPSMHHRLGSATLSELAFPGESNPNFPWESPHWDNTVVTLPVSRTCVMIRLNKIECLEFVVSEN